MDNPAADDDTVAEAPAKLLTVIQNYKPNSVQDFYLGWSAMFGSAIQPLYERTFAQLLSIDFLRQDRVFTGIERSVPGNDPYALCPETDPSDRNTWRIFNINPEFSNISSVNLRGLIYVVNTISAGNTLINADDAPPAGGVGSTVTVPDTELGPDGILVPGESFHIQSNTGEGSFFICLAPSRSAFQFEVDVLGFPIP